MYADNLVLISPSATGMKELLCACEVYSLEHAIVGLYNSKKSTVLCVEIRPWGHAVRPSFIVNGDVIPEAEKVKYLGHIICCELSDDEDMMRQRRHLYGQGSQKLYNWPNILSPPHYRNGVHHTVEMICLLWRTPRRFRKYSYSQICFVDAYSLPNW